MLSENKVELGTQGHSSLSSLEIEPSFRCVVDDIGREAVIDNTTNAKVNAKRIVSGFVVGREKRSNHRIAPAKKDPREGDEQEKLIILRNEREAVADASFLGGTKFLAFIRLAVSEYSHEKGNASFGRRIVAVV